jgi:hypothetical protein
MQAPPPHAAQHPAEPHPDHAESWDYRPLEHEWPNLSFVARVPAPPEPQPYAPPETEPYAPPETEPYAEPEPPPLSEPVPSAPATNVAVIDAGPFEDLVVLRSFEEALQRLPRVDSVQVRRYRQQRAQVELVLEASTSASAELRRLTPSLEVDIDEEGRLVVNIPVLEERQRGGEPAPGAEASPAESDAS